MATNGGNGNGANNGGRAGGPRCVALVGPFQSGKTTLLEAILARTGAIPRQGTVEAGNTVGDASKEARHHHMSVELTVATTNFMGDAYTFLDCPGSVEFAHDMRAVLPAIDTAIVGDNRLRLRLRRLRLILRLRTMVALAIMLAGLVARRIGLRAIRLPDALLGGLRRAVGRQFDFTLLRGHAGRCQ